MELYVEDAEMFFWADQVVTAIYWSDAEAEWRWSVSYRRNQEWGRWDRGMAPSFERACLAMAHSLTRLARREGGVL